MYLNRKIDHYLIEWKAETVRKPLLLRGARQVGKTSAIKNFSSNFEYFLSINFDERRDYVKVFETTTGIDDVCEQLSLLTGTPIIAGKTLVFFDEIQVSVQALQMLRYFYEKMPELHVIAAGSLLEFALEEIPAFGAGRVRSVFMYPFSFEEFLVSIGESALIPKMLHADYHHPLQIVIHQKLSGLYKKFLLIGGMPEAVRAYVKGDSILNIQRVLNDLIIALEADFAKYKKRFPGGRLTEVFRAIAYQTGQKFTYSYNKGSLSNVQIKEAIRLLCMAGIVYPVIHTAANGIPIGAEINPKKIKYLLYDTGIFQRLLGLELGDMMIQDEFTSINKGNIVELSVGLELIKNTDPFEPANLYYWHREAQNSQAEVDYVIQSGNEIYPIEVKSGTKGSMQSMYLFMKEKKSMLGYRLSFENFSSIDSVKIMPVYVAGKLSRRG
ncbi:MAG: AAA family ATPase [Chitinophagaceae bacterium]|nr:AAA family ATPase [Chitinophagaceae bacterium]